MRYIVMSMSLRDRAVWRRPAASSPHASTIRRSTKKKRSSQVPSYRGLFHPGDIETVERVADDACVGARHDLLLREHDQVGVVDGHERSEELRLRVLEVLVEDAGHVFGIEAHVGRAYLRPRLRRFASRRYAPSVPAGNWRQRPRPM